MPSPPCWRRTPTGAAAGCPDLHPHDPAAALLMARRGARPREWRAISPASARRRGLELSAARQSHANWPRVRRMVSPSTATYHHDQPTPPDHGEPTEAGGPRGPGGVGPGRREHRRPPPVPAVCGCAARTATRAPRSPRPSGVGVIPAASPGARWVRRNSDPPPQRTDRRRARENDMTSRAAGLTARGGAGSRAGGGYASYVEARSLGREHRAGVWAVAAVAGMGDPDGRGADREPPADRATCAADPLSWFRAGLTHNPGMAVLGLTPAGSPP